MEIVRDERARNPQKTAARAKGTTNCCAYHQNGLQDKKRNVHTFPRTISPLSGYNPHDGERYFKMESIKVPKALQELLLSLPSLPKENNGIVDTFVSQAVSPGPPSANTGMINAKFVDCFPEVLEVLVNLLTRDDNPGLQLRALQALEDLVVAPHDAYEIKSKVVRCPGALTGLFVLLANDNNPGFQVRSALIIKHLANGNFETKTNICNHPGALHGLVVSLTKDSNPSLQQNTAKALSILAAREYSIQSKTVLKFVLEGLVTPIENGTDSVHLSLETLASRNSATGCNNCGVIIAKKNKDVPISIDLKDMQLRMQRMQMEIPSVDEVFESLGTFLQDFEEAQIGQEQEAQLQDGGIGCMEDGKRKASKGGCYPLRPWLWPARFLRKGKVAALPENRLDDASKDLSMGRNPELKVTNNRLLPEVLLTSISETLESKDIHQQRKTLQDLCDQTQEALDDNTASFLAQRPAEALKGLVSLLANPSLRPLVRSVLKNLVATNQEIMATTVELLLSLAIYSNPLQESAVWGLGGLAADSDNIKAEIVNQPGALKSLVNLLRKNTNYRIRGTTAVALRNLAATIDGKIKATACNYPGALDGLVDALTVDEETIEPSWTINFGVQKNAALALGHLACGHKSGKLKALIVSHPGVLPRLVTALTNLWSPALQQNAAFALGNLAGGDIRTKAKIMDHPGALLGLTLALTRDRTRSPALQQHAAFALGNLAGGDEQMKATIVDHPLTLRFLMDSLRENSNPALQKNAAWALGVLSTGENETKSKIVYHGGVIEGLELSALNQDNVGMRRHLKWASRNLAANDDVETIEKTKICRELSEAFSFKGEEKQNTGA